MPPRPGDAVRGCVPRASLTEGLVALNRRPVGGGDRRRAVLHWLDWLGCVAAAREAPAARALMQWRPLPPAGAAQAPASPMAWPSLAGRAASDMHAVWLDAGLANIEEMDDMHREALLHPGPVVLPVLAHLARHAGLGARTLLDALVRGYEASVRVGRSLGPAHYARCHNTATAGVFGAAAAAADALGLSDEACIWALGNAGTQAAGWWQVRLEPVMSKQLHTGHAAWAGLCAAQLAQAGFTGPRFILEGEKGFYAALCPDARPERVLAPESRWLIHDTSFKPWPACRHAHATIDAMLALRAQLGGQPLAFVEARVETYADAVHFCSRVHPATRTEAKFSLPHCLAVAALHGALVPESFDAPAFLDPGVQALAARVRLAVGEPFDSAYPAHFGARVSVRLPDGREGSQQVADASGDPERPLPPAAIFDKAATLMAYGRVPAARAAAALDAARRLMDQVDGPPGGEPVARGLTDPLW